MPLPLCSLALVGQMGKSKRPRHRRVNATGRNDTEQYLHLGYPFLRSDAWRSLSGPAVKVFLELWTRFHGGNNGKLALSLDQASRLLGLGKATVQRAFKELVEKGFVKLVTRGHWYGRKATEWALTTKTINGELPTNDWKRWAAPKKTNSRFPSGPYLMDDGSESEPK